MEEGEFGLVARLVARLPQRGGVLLGPGDDAAVIAAADGRVVVTTDLLVEGRHFRRDWSDGYDVGRKAAAQSLADIAAMGASPTALVVGLAAPADLPAAWVDDLARGLDDECAPLGASVSGGDVTATDTLTVAVTALGDLAGRAPVTRAGARPSEVVVVAGRLGFAAAGLALLQAGHAQHPLVAAHRRPLVDYAAAGRLAAAGATSMIDVSDGLLADIGHLAAASGVDIELTAGALPVPPELVGAGKLLGVDPLLWVATGGDDHAFAATLPAGRSGGFPVIGGVVAGGGVVTVVDRQLPGPAGHEHFRS